MFLKKKPDLYIDFDGECPESLQPEKPQGKKHIFERILINNGDLTQKIAIKLARGDTLTKCAGMME